MWNDRICCLTTNKGDSDSRVALGVRVIFSGICRIAAALGVAVVPVVAVAQVTPPSEQPGRERERFIKRVPPRAKPSVPAISLPTGNQGNQGQCQISSTEKLH